MVDHIDKKHRSWNMSRIRSKNSKPEVLLRSLLHHAGFRFRINDKRFQGNPDIFLSKYNTAIFIHGCFWHRHENCSRATLPNTNAEYWIQKFKRNLIRDYEVREKLKEQGINVIIVWECEILKDPFMILDDIINRLNPEHSYNINSERYKLLKIAEKKSKYLIQKDNKAK